MSERENFFARLLNRDELKVSALVVSGILIRYAQENLREGTEGQVAGLISLGVAIGVVAARNEIAQLLRPQTN